MAIAKATTKRDGMAAARGAGRVRERILDVASGLFYREGVRAVGVDLVVERAGVAKTSLYRHFPTKDDLIAAFLDREDADFWRHWDEVAGRHAGAPKAELDAHMAWIGARIERPNYRGCPQINTAAEFADAHHPARRVAARHKSEMRRRLAVLAKKLGARRPEELAQQFGFLIDGAFVSGQVAARGHAAATLQRAANALLAGATA